MYDIILICIIGYTLNAISLIFITIWSFVLVFPSISELSEINKLREYSKESKYKLFTIVTLFIPYIISFRCYKFIITYSFLEKEYKFKNVVDLLIMTDINLSSKRTY